MHTLCSLKEVGADAASSLFSTDPPTHRQRVTLRVWMQEVTVDQWLVV